MDVPSSQHVDGPLSQCMDKNREKIHKQRIGLLSHFYSSKLNKQDMRTDILTVEQNCLKNLRQLTSSSGEN